MQYFNFEGLIEKYSCEFTAIVSSEGKYDDSGEWVKGETREIPMTEHMRKKAFDFQVLRFSK